MVYIDGPSVKKIDGKKMPNQDIFKLFDCDILPKVIMVDGRNAVVNAIKESKCFDKYILFSNVSNSIDSKELRSYFKFHYHSIFLLKGLR